MKSISLFVFILLGLVFTSTNAQNLPAYLPSNGLVAWYPFNGNANDESGNGNHGTVNGATLTADRNGNANSAFLLNGINANIDLGYAVLNSPTNYTIAGWCKINSSQFGYLFSQGNTAEIQIVCPGNGTFVGSTKLTNDAWIGVGGEANPLGTWVFFASIFDRSNSLVSFYWNNVIYTSTIPSGVSIWSWVGNANFGRQANYVGNYFSGEIDDIGFWNRALTDSEIQNIKTLSALNNNNGGNTTANAVPPGIPYQAVVRNANGQVASNAAATTKFTLHQNTTDGAVEFQETHALTTNAQGLVSAVIGQGTAVQGTFAGINWSNTTKFLQVEVDLGNGYVDLGTQQLMSVPFALYAANGPQGPAGPAGPQGPAGADGAMGATGPQGEAGPQGPIGLTGPAGPTGATGPQGPIGLTGPAGPSGATGPQGPAGAQGPIGLTGPQGAQGEQGIQGEIGPQGNQGETGPQGLMGLTGPAGAIGLSAYEVWLSLGNIGSEQDFINSLKENGAGISIGSTPGQILFWNGTNWASLEPGQNGQILQIQNGLPTWKNNTAAQGNFPAHGQSVFYSDTLIVIDTDIKLMQIEMQGARGGKGGNANINYGYCNGSNGGSGMLVNFYVTPNIGDTLHIKIGQNGTDGYSIPYQCSGYYGTNGTNGTYTALSINDPTFLNFLLKCEGGTGGGGTYGSQNPYCSCGSTYAIGADGYISFGPMFNNYGAFVISENVNNGIPRCVIKW